MRDHGEKTDGPAFFDSISIAGQAHQESRGIQSSGMTIGVKE
jgi:hypothetical protein